MSKSARLNKSKNNSKYSFGSFSTAVTAEQNSPIHQVAMNQEIECEDVDLSYITAEFFTNMMNSIPLSTLSSPTAEATSPPSLPAAQQPIVTYTMTKQIPSTEAIDLSELLRTEFMPNTIMHQNVLNPLMSSNVNMNDVPIQEHFEINVEPQNTLQATKLVTMNQLPKNNEVIITQFIPNNILYPKPSTSSHRHRAASTNVNQVPIQQCFHKNAEPRNIRQSSKLPTTISQVPKNNEVIITQFIPNSVLRSNASRLSKSANVNKIPISLQHCFQEVGSPSSGYPSPRPTNPKDMPLRQYLQESVESILYNGFKYLINERPPNPVEALAIFLLQNKPPSDKDYDSENVPPVIEQYELSDSD